MHRVMVRGNLQSGAVVILKQFQAIRAPGIVLVARRISKQRMAAQTGSAGAQFEVRVARVGVEVTRRRNAVTLFDCLRNCGPGSSKSGTNDSR